MRPWSTAAKAVEAWDAELFLASHATDKETTGGELGAFNSLWVKEKKRVYLNEFKVRLSLSLSSIL